MKINAKVAGLLSLLLAAIAGLSAFSIVYKSDSLETLVNALQRWSDTTSQEKVYLHFDKPYYAVGDTLWFKGYVTTGSRHQLSAISGALYVDLINERDSVLKSLKLPVSAGMAMGDIALGDELTTGNYRIRAYTQWMRNAGEEYFFDRTFTVGSVFNNGIVTKANYQYEDDKGKAVLTATLNYADDNGSPLVNRNVLYRIMIDKQTVYTKNTRTDAGGNIKVSIAGEIKGNLNGAYIRTILDNNQSKEVIKDFPIKANLSQSDVQFFSEGGNLVNGVVSRVAFKVVGIDGLGLNVAGQVLDDNNKIIVDIGAAHAGMGSFRIKPEANKTYTAKLNFSDGTIKSVVLPRAEEEGYVLSVYQPNKDSVLVRVNTQQPKQAQILNLIIQSGGEVITASTIKIERPLTSLWIEKKDFPTGIAQFTLFDVSNNPINERVAFIRGNDQLNLALRSNKGSYKSKEKVVINLEAKDTDEKPAAGNFSVSVIDESKIPSDEVNESTILSYLLLRSDLKGYIEKPNYYFTNVNDQVDNELDNLMLTQGYRRFEWKEIINNNLTVQQPGNKIKFPAENYGINISGQVQTLGSKPLPNAVVTLLSVKARMDRSALSDANGRFKFEGIVIKDSVKFTIQARTGKNSDKLKLIIDSLPKMRVTPNPNLADISLNIPETLKAYTDVIKKQDDINERMGRLNEVHRLRQVNIRAVKEKKQETSFQWGLQVPAGHADKTLNIDEKEMERYGSLGMFLASGVIPNVHTTNPFGALPMARTFNRFGMRVDMPVKVILNGRLLNSDEALGVFDNSFLECTDIIKIEAVISSIALKSMLGNGSSPLLLITTKPPASRTQHNFGVANINPKGFNIAREFYSPKYTTAASQKTPDIRSTIYWDPHLKTDGEGKGNFTFFNGDGPGAYKVVVEGIDAYGRLGRQVLRYQVDGELVNGRFFESQIYRNGYVQQRLPHFEAFKY